MSIPDGTAPVAGSARGFGLTFFGVFLIVGLWPWIWGGEVRVWSMAVAAVFGLLAVLRPGILSPLNRLWHRFGLAVSVVMTPVVMSLLFIIAAIPTGLFMKLLGHDPMRRRFESDASTYWIPRKSQPGPMRDQF